MPTGFLFAVGFECENEHESGSQHLEKRKCSSVLTATMQHHYCGATNHNWKSAVPARAGGVIALEQVDASLFFSLSYFQIGAFSVQNIERGFQKHSLSTHAKDRLLLQQVWLNV